MNALIDPAKFQDPMVTAKGEIRARVAFEELKTLWFNTGSLCNIECANCYIKSSPKADHFLYLTPDDMDPYLEEVKALGYQAIEIGFTGGEPCMNPHFIRLSEMALEGGHDLLVLTNAMKPMMRPRVKAGLLDLKKRFGDKLTMRVSLDHFTAIEHDRERGPGSYVIALEGLDWLAQHGFKIHIAGRAMFSESDENARAGYSSLIANQGWNIDAHNPAELILFPEMDDQVDIPEITTACWDILDSPIYPSTRS